MSARAARIELRAAELAAGCGSPPSRRETRGRSFYFCDFDPGDGDEEQAGWLSAHIECEAASGERDTVSG